ncbi:MAG: hypothetical protein E4H33_00205 [Anaerolineales bacterium]|nr:MAG: hypothetical protein E4H33_00205 [Anaerolineales bacterium]
MLNLLQKNGREAAERARIFSEAELDQAESVSLNGDAPLTTQVFIEYPALRHSFQHLESIRKGLGK